MDQRRAYEADVIDIFRNITQPPRPRLDTRDVCNEWEALNTFYDALDTFTKVVRRAEGLSELRGSQLTDLLGALHDATPRKDFWQHEIEEGQNV